MWGKNKTEFNEGKSTGSLQLEIAGNIGKQLLDVLDDETQNDS